MNAKEKYWDGKRKVFDKYTGACAYCGDTIDFESFQVDHIVSKHHIQYHNLSGSLYEDLDNLNPACFSCNNYKRAHSLETFREEIAAQIMRLRRDHPTFRLAERYGLISCEEKEIQFHFEKMNQYG